jgi:hypothetical protein
MLKKADIYISGDYMIKKFIDYLDNALFGPELVYKLASGQVIEVEYDENQYARIKNKGVSK